MSHDQEMEGGSHKKEHPAGIKRGGKKQKLAALDTDKQYLDSLKESGKRKEETSSNYDTVSTQPPSGNETAVTIGQFGLQGWGPRNLSTKPEMSFSSRSTADSISKHIVSFPSIIWVQWQQPNKPCGLHFYVCRLSKKCHRSRNCCYTEWVFCSLCTCTQGLIDSNSYGRFNIIFKWFIPVVCENITKNIKDIR